MDKKLEMAITQAYTNLDRNNGKRSTIVDWAWDRLVEAYYSEEEASAIRIYLSLPREAFANQEEINHFRRMVWMVWREVEAHWDDRDRCPEFDREYSKRYWQ